MRAFLISKTVKNAKKMNSNELVFYLKSRYLTDNRNQITVIQGIPGHRDVPCFETISEELRAMEEDENMSLKNKFLFGGWISPAAKTYIYDKVIKGKKLPHRFERLDI